LLDRKRRKQFQSDIKQSEDALISAKKDLNDAIGAAKQKRIDAELGAEQPEDVAPPEVKTPEIIKKLKGQVLNLGDLLSTKVKQSFDITGSFSVFALKGLGVGTTAERTAKATEATAKNTKKIVQQVQQNKLVFN